MRSFSSACDTDFVDLAILGYGKGKPANGFLEDEARLWLLMRWKYSGQDGKFSHILASQTPSAYQDQRFHGADEYAGANNVYSFSPRLVDQGQSFNQSLYTYFPQQKFANDPISKSYQHDILGNYQCRNEVDGMAELKRNERLGFNKYFTGYGNHFQTFQGFGSGDVSARVFGM